MISTTITILIALSVATPTAFVAHGVMKAWRWGFSPKRILMAAIRMRQRKTRAVRFGPFQEIASRYSLEIARFVTSLVTAVFSLTAVATAYGQKSKAATISLTAITAVTACTNFLLELGILMDDGYMESQINYEADRQQIGGFVESAGISLAQFWAPRNNETKYQRKSPQTPKIEKSTSVEEEQQDPISCETESWEAVSSVFVAIIGGIAAAWGSNKSVVMVLGHVFQNFGKSYSSTKSMYQVVHDIWSSFCPDAAAAQALQAYTDDVNRLESIFTMDTAGFVTLDVQREIAELISVRDKVHLRTLDQRNPVIVGLNQRWGVTFGKILSKQNELAALIHNIMTTRRKPVFINLRGPGGHGKSFMMETLYHSIVREMIRRGHMDKPMKKMIGTGGGDDYIPPMADQEWFQIDEYLASYDDKWIGLMNAIVSDNPVTLSSAFVKFFCPSPMFVVTTSNVTLPFSPPPSHKNYMRGEVRDAWNSRHNFFEIIKEDYDPSVARDHQNRSIPPSVYKEPYTCKSGNMEGSWGREKITYQDLVAWAVDEWEHFDRKFKTAVAKNDAFIASLPVSAIAEAIEVEQSPRVLGIYGKPGTGKTYMLKNFLMPILKLTHKVKIYKDLISGPDMAYNCHIIDDLIGPRNDFIRYKEFYDKIPGDHIVIVLDNWVPKSTWRFAFMLPSVFNIRALLDCIRSWITPIYDVSDLPHISLARRMGVSVPSIWRGEYSFPATERATAVLVTPFGVTELKKGKSQPTESFCREWAYGVAQFEEPKEVEQLSVEPDLWDVDIHVPDVESSTFISAYCNPRSDSYVRISPRALRIFPDYEAFFSMREITHEHAIEMAKAALRRGDVSLSVRVAGHVMKAYKGQIQTNFISEGRQRMALRRHEKVEFHYSNGTVQEITYLQIHQAAIEIKNIPPEDLQWTTKEIDSVRASYAYNQYASDIDWRAYKESLLAKSAMAFRDVWERIKTHPVLSALILGMPLIVGGASIIWLARKRTSSEDDTEEKVKNFFERESFEQQKQQVEVKRTSLYRESEEPRRVVVNARREPLTGAVHKESFELTKHRMRTQRAPLATHELNHDEVRTESVAGLRIRPSISGEADYVIKEVHKAMVVCIDGARSNFGIFTGGRGVLTVAHLLKDDVSRLTIMESDGQDTKSWTAEPLFVDRGRDIAYLTILEKAFPARKSLRPYFIKEANLPKIYQTLVCLPNGLTLGGNASYRSEVVPGSFYDPSNLNWTPTRRLVVTTFLTHDRLTAKGDCGTPVIALSAKMGTGILTGIHIGSTGAGTVGSRSVAATLTQEELKELESFGKIPLRVESSENEPMYAYQIQDGPVVAVTGTIADLLDETYVQENNIPKNDRIKAIGFNQGLYEPSYRRGGKIQRSPLSRDVDLEVIPLSKSPSPVNYTDAIITDAAKEAMVKDSGGRPSIGISQLAKIAGPLGGGGEQSDPKLEIPLAKCERIANVFFEMMQNWQGIENYTVLSIEEALNGSEDPFFDGLIGPMRTDTSAGFPYKQLYKAPLKSDAIAMNEDTGHRVLSQNKAGIYCAKAVDMLWDSIYYPESPAPIHVVECHLKVETLLNEKAAEGGTRLFYVESLDHVIFQKQLGGALQGLVMRNRFTKFCHHTTGINPYVDFTRLYQQLSTIGNKGLDWDYKRFDKRAPHWGQVVMGMVFKKVFEQILQLHGELSQRMAYALTRDLFEKYYLFEGVLYESFEDFSSGNGMTNTAGSMLNDFYIIGAVLEIGYTKWRRWLTCGEIHDLLWWATNGDDVIMTVHSTVESVFTFRAFKAAMVDFHMTITPSDKDGEDYDLKDIKTLGFLGRSFEFDLIDKACQRPHGQLRKSALEGMIHWTEDPSKVQAMAVLDSWSREMRAHDKEYYDKAVATVRKSLRTLAWEYPFLTWEEARQNLRDERDEVTSIML